MGRLAELRELILGGGPRPSAAGRPGQRPRPGGSAVGPGGETTGGLDVGLQNDQRSADTYRLLLVVDSRPAGEWRGVRLAPGQRWSRTAALRSDTPADPA